METKQCSKCKEVKPLTEFCRMAASTDGYDYQCKKCKNEYQRQYRANRPGKRREYGQRYCEQVNERGHQWRAENPNYHHQYRIDNAGKYRAYTANRKALSIAAEGTFTDEQFVELCNKYGNRCLCCGKDNVKLVVDHIVPLSKGGSNNLNNVQPLCGLCNSKKHTKTIDYRPDKDDLPPTR